MPDSPVLDHTGREVYRHAGFVMQEAQSERERTIDFSFIECAKVGSRFEAGKASDVVTRSAVPSRIFPTLPKRHKDEHEERR